MTDHRIVIAGAGYAGLSCALRLARRAPAGTSITLVSATDRFIERIRLHQRAFRERVLEAYQRQCAFCQLRHDELLDAAHLIPDADPAGDPVVSNGVSLCALHHAAFDKYFIGIRPDYVIEVRPDLLTEKDGPTLAHAIQGMHMKRLLLPRRREHHPEVRCLEMRYDIFQRGAHGR